MCTDLSVYISNKSVLIRDLRMDIKEYLKKRAKLIDRNLERFLPPADTEPRIIHRAMRYSVFSGGKRLRPILATEASAACGGNLSDVMPVACALELIHTYSIIHDDLPSMDNDDYRRGKPTLHRKFDEAIAILAGDALLTLSFNLMARCKASSIRQRVIEEVSKAIGTFGMIGGQVMDLKAKKKGSAALKYIHDRKTASLIAASASVGAITAGAKAKKINALKAFGKFFGLSFQIIDDLLDKEDYYEVFGEEKSRQQAQALAHKANVALRPFGRKGERLKEITSFMLTRKR